MQRQRKFNRRTSSTSGTSVEETAKTGKIIAGIENDSGTTDDTALESRFQAPQGIAVHPGDGDLFIADSNGNCVRKLAQNECTHYIGDGETPPNDDFKVALLGTEARLYCPQGLRIAMDGASILVCDGAQASRVLRIDMLSKDVTVTAGGNGEGGEDGLVGEASFTDPIDVGEDFQGNLWIACDTPHTLRVATFDGKVETKAGKHMEAGCLPQARQGVFTSNRHKVNKTEKAEIVIKKFRQEQTEKTVEGETVQAVKEIWQVARKSEINRGKSKDGKQLQDRYHTVRWNQESLDMLNKIIPDGIDLTGNITIESVDPQEGGKVVLRQGSARDGPMVEFRNPLDTSLKVICKGRESRFKRIMAVCIDHLSRDPERPDVYFCDMGNHRVCKYSVAEDTVENIAGPVIMDLENDKFGARDNKGEQGYGWQVGFSEPVGMVMSAAGNIYIAEKGANRIRRLERPKIADQTQQWHVSTVIEFPLETNVVPNSLCFSPDGSHIIFTDRYSHVIRSIPLPPEENAKPTCVNIEGGNWMMRPKLVTDSMLVRKLSKGMSKLSIQQHLESLDENDRLAQVLYQMESGLAPLHFACGVSKKADPELVRDMYRAGAESEPDKWGRRPMHYACGAAHEPCPDSVKILLDEGAECLHLDSYGRLPLHYACGATNPACSEVVKLLLEHKPAKRMKDQFYKQEHLCKFDNDLYAPIHYAAGAGSPQELHSAVGQKWIAAHAMKLLFHHGADMKVVDPKNRTLFNYGSTGCSIVAKTVSSDGGEEDDPSVYMPPNQMPLGRMLRVVMDDVVEEVQKCKSWKEETTMKTMTRARRLMEDFYNSEFAVARAKKNFLVKIFNLRRHEHLAMYNTVLAGIRKDPLFNMFIVRSEALMKQVEDRFEKSLSETRRQALYHSAGDPGAYQDGSEQKLGGRLCEQSSQYLTLDGAAQGSTEESFMGKYTMQAKDSVPNWGQCTEHPVYICEGKDAKIPMSGKEYCYYNALKKEWQVSPMIDDSASCDLCITAPSTDMWVSQVAGSTETWKVMVGGKYNDCPDLKVLKFTLEDSYYVAMNVSERYRLFCEALAHKVGSEFKCSRLKSFYRSMEKAVTNDHKQSWHGEYVVDIVRGAIVFEKMNTMLMAIEVLAACDAPRTHNDELGLREGLPEARWKAGADGLEGIFIERIKNRFERPTDGGWADCVINFRFRGDSNHHICEIQLIHSELMMVRERMGAHHGYALFRSAYEMLQKTEQLPQNLDGPKAMEDVASTGGKSTTVDISEKTITRISALEETVRTNQATIQRLNKEVEELRNGSPGGSPASPGVPGGSPPRQDIQLPRSSAVFADALQVERVLVSGNGLTTTTSGRPTKFTIHTYRSKLVPGQDKFTISIVKQPTTERNTTAPGTVVDNRDGTHTVTYKVDSPGVYCIHVLSGSTPVPRSPFLVSCSE